MTLDMGHAQMVKFILTAASILSLCSGCASSNLNKSLGTSKNPHPVLSYPEGSEWLQGNKSTINPFILQNFTTILEGNRQYSRQIILDKSFMRVYVSSGFALSDIYCEEFFRDADESMRRRKFGRGLTSDVGTAMTSVLGLANAGENVVSGVAAGFGLGDKLWRQYDEAFLISPDLSAVRSLVLAAQDKFREESLGDKAKLPIDLPKAQSVILRYANFCSNLGMKALLNQSAEQQRLQITAQTSPNSNNTSTAKSKDSSSLPPANAAPQAIPGQ